MKLRRFACASVVAVVLVAGFAVPAMADSPGIIRAVCLSLLKQLGIVNAAGVPVIPAAAYPLTAPDGTFGAPSYAFSSEASTGLYRPGTGLFGIAAAQVVLGASADVGFKRSTIQSVNGLAVTNGSTGYGSLMGTDLRAHRDGGIGWSDTLNDPTATSTTVLSRTSATVVTLKDNGGLGTSNKVSFGTGIGFTAQAGMCFGFAPSTDSTTAIDSGIARVSAGILEVTTSGTPNASGFLTALGLSANSGSTSGWSMGYATTAVLSGGSATIFGWSATTDAAALDTGLSRDAAGVVDFGTGAQGSKAGSWKATSGTLTGTLTLTGASVAGSPSATLGATTVTTLGTGGNVTLADGNNIIVNTTTGTQIATGTTQKLGFFGATPVVQVSGSTDVLASLVTLGLRAASSNPALNLGSGAITCGAETASGLITANGGLTNASGLAQGFTTGGLIVAACNTGAPSGAAANGNLVMGADNHLWVRLNGAWSQLDAQAPATPTLGAVCNSGNQVNSVSASKNIAFATGGTFAAGSTSEFYGPTDTGTFISAGTPGSAGAGKDLTLSGGIANGSGNVGGNIFFASALAGTGTSSTQLIEIVSNGQMQFLTGLGAISGGHIVGPTDQNFLIQSGATNRSLLLRACDGSASAGAVCNVSGGNGVGTDKNGGTLTLYSGNCTGAGVSRVKTQTGFKAASSSSAQTAYDRIDVTSQTFTCSLTTATADNFCNFTLSTADTGMAAEILYLVEIFDGAHHISSISGSMWISAENSNGTVTAGCSTAGTSNQNFTQDASNTFGTVACTTTATVSGTSALAKVTPSWSAGTPTTVRCTYQIRLNGQASITEN